MTTRTNGRGRMSHDWLRLIGEAYPRFVQQVFPDAP
jgi:hypothetical protein